MQELVGGMAIDRDRRSCGMFPMVNAEELPRWNTRCSLTTMTLEENNNLHHNQCTGIGVRVWRPRHIYPSASALPKDVAQQMRIYSINSYWRYLWIGRATSCL
jgi:hypothetical protein